MKKLTNKYITGFCVFSTNGAVAYAALLPAQAPQFVLNWQHFTKM